MSIWFRFEVTAAYQEVPVTFCQRSSNHLDKLSNGPDGQVAEGL